MKLKIYMCNRKLENATAEEFRDLASNDALDGVQNEDIK
jgi:hypothetical protein